MLKNTFIHIPGIGIITEQRFWDSGIYSWKDFIQNCPIRLSQLKMDSISSCLIESHQHLESGNPNYFFDLLSANSTGGFFLNSEIQPYILILKQRDWKIGEMK